MVWWRELARRLRPGGRVGLEVERFASFRRWRQAAAGRRRREDRRRSYEVALLDRGESFSVDGWCYVCSGPRAFHVDYDYAYEVDGRLVPNWRERLVCPECQLNNRMRAAVHLLDELGAAAGGRTYVTEQLTPLYGVLAARFPGAVGSEFLGDGFAAGQVDGRGLRHEDLTELSFDDASFDLVISFDVFEHVPDYLRAFGECLRVLAPGGLLFFTVPFRIDRPDNLVRARLGAEGEVEHLEPPEYHGDPLSEAGCLAFYHYGWALLDELRQLGYADVQLAVYWSQRYGYLGRDQLVLSARRPR